MSTYERVLRLKHMRLRGWQREALTWGLAVLSVLLTLTGLVSPWAILVLPLVMAAVLKAHDLLTGRLAAGAPLPVGLAHEGANSNGGTNSNEGPNSNEPPVSQTEGS